MLCAPENARAAAAPTHSTLTRPRTNKTQKQPKTGKSEYVQGLTLKECATLLNIDVHDASLMSMVFDTALAIKERIYGNRIVLFAPLYIANYCVNSCTYCAFRAGNKKLTRTALGDADIKAEVEALQRQGHRRLLVLTGEHPKYTFDQFLHVRECLFCVFCFCFLFCFDRIRGSSAHRSPTSHPLSHTQTNKQKPKHKNNKALDVIKGVRSEPCGEIRRINVEIPTLSVSDMRRLKATDCVGTFTLFQVCVLTSGGDGG